MKKQIPWLVILSGAVTGLAALLLTYFGNPANMGFCIACFLRDIAGSLGLHSAGKVQYFRPEILGLVLGACLVSLVKKEFRPRAGSAPATRFVLGGFVIVGALMFLGCPLRMFLRLGGGDLNALVGLVGFTAGIFVGTLFLNRGFSLGRAYKQPVAEGAAFPALLAILGICALIVPALFRQSEEGPGSMAAPWLLALGCGLVVGGLAQRSRLCTVGGIRDAILFHDFNLLWGAAALLVTVFIGNLCLGSFNPGFAGQSIAHTDGLWNFLGMALVGWGSVLLGGCPLRQLILTGEGSGDSAVTVLGMIFGGALCHNFGLTSSGEGPTVAGRIAVLIGFVVVSAISLANCQKEA